MPKRGENIYKRKDGRWEGRYIKGRDSNGKAMYGYIYADTYRDVKGKLLHIKHQVETKNAVQHVSQDAFFDEVIDAWLQYISFNIKESTRARYRYIVAHYIRPALGLKLTKELTAVAVEGFIQSLLYDAAGKVWLSEKTAGDILVIVKAIIKYGNLRGFSIPCNTQNIRIKTITHTGGVISLDDQQQLSKWLMSDKDPCKLGVLLSLYTGIRIGELCALKWKHILFEEGILQVCGTMQRISKDAHENGAKTKIIVDNPKSRYSYRDIPLPKFIIDYAAELKCEPEAYVLTGEQDRFIEPRTLQYRFKRYLEQCGIPYVNFHTLRHTFATRCIELGFEVKSLSEILGHANVNITMNRYVHSSMYLKRENMEKLCSIV